MAKFIDLFTFSGKVGGLVGCSGPSGFYVRSKPRATSKPPTAKQLAARKRFALVMDFLTPLREIIYLGFAAKGDRRHYKTGALSRAVSHACRHAVAGSYPSQYINPREIRLSEGGLAPLRDATTQLSETGMVQVAWSNAKSTCDDGRVFDDDRVFVIVYVHGSRLLLLGESLRSSGAIYVDVSAEPPGTELLVYACAAERDLSRFSNSQFLERMIR